MLETPLDEGCGETSCWFARPKVPPFPTDNQPGGDSSHVHGKAPFVGETLSPQGGKVISGDPVEALARLLPSTSGPMEIDGPARQLCETIVCAALEAMAICYGVMVLLRSCLLLFPLL